MTAFVSAVLAVVLFSGHADGAGKRLYLVQNVIDGDTILLANGEKVRYIGIDAPETMKKTGEKWQYDPEQFGDEAKEFNRVLVFRKKVSLEYDKEKRDRYGRLLAYVYTADGVMVNRALIEKGYVLMYTISPNNKHIEDFYATQEKAKAGGAGLWGISTVINDGEAAKNFKKFRNVEGVVTDVKALKHKIIISFGQEGPGQFAALIYGDNLRFFSRKGIDPVKEYKGKKVRVFGKIQDKNGPKIYIDNPTQIWVVGQE